MQKELPHRRLWQAALLNRKTRRDAIPINISLFKRIKNNIGLRGYRRIRIKDSQDSEDSEGVRTYRKDTYGTTLIFINTEKSTVEGRAETWSGLMAVCDEFDLKLYRTA